MEEVLKEECQGREASQWGRREHTPGLQPGKLQSLCGQLAFSTPPSSGTVTRRWPRMFNTAVLRCCLQQRPGSGRTAWSGLFMASPSAWPSTLASMFISSRCLARPARLRGGGWRWRCCMDCRGLARALRTQHLQERALCEHCSRMPHFRGRASLTSRSSPLRCPPPSPRLQKTHPEDLRSLMLLTVPSLGCIQGVC